MNNVQIDTDNKQNWWDSIKYVYPDPQKRSFFGEKLNFFQKNLTFLKDFYNGVEAEEAGWALPFWLFFIDAICVFTFWYIFVMFLL